MDASAKNGSNVQVIREVLVNRDVRGAFLNACHMSMTLPSETLCFQIALVDISGM